MISVGSKAVSDHAATPSRNGQFPPRRQEGRLHDSQFKMESAMSENCVLIKSVQVLGLSICQNPKLQLWADTREVLALSYPSPWFSVIPLCQLTEIWE